MVVLYDYTRAFPLLVGIFLTASVETMNENHFIFRRMITYSSRSGAPGMILLDCKQFFYFPGFKVNPLHGWGATDAADTSTCVIGQPFSIRRKIVVVVQIVVVGSIRQLHHFDLRF